MMKAIYIFFCGMVCATSVFGQDGVWTPNALFHLKDANPQQTQIFVSGLSFGLTAYSQALKEKGNPRLFCMPDHGFVTSPIIYDILNLKHAGKTIKAEQATATVMRGLQEKFPCK